MKTESEITAMLKHCIYSYGMVSPDVTRTLQWVLGLISDDDRKDLFYWRDEY